MTDNVPDSTRTVAPGVSKLALLASFVAGAFAAWIIITMNTQADAPAEPATTSAPTTMMAPSQTSDAPSAAPGDAASAPGAAPAAPGAKPAAPSVPKPQTGNPKAKP